MGSYMVFLFVVVPVLELWLLIRIGTVIGASTTILLVLTTAFVGMALARSQGFQILMRAQEALNRGELPNEALFDGIFILIGGILLLTPGFITDTVGFFFLLPPTRALLKDFLKRKWRRAMQQGRTVYIYRSGFNRF